MKSKINPTGFIVFGVILVIVSAFLVHSYNNVTKKYETDGIEVNCVTVEVVSGRKGKQTVTGAYLKDSGETVTASVIRNGKTYVGEEYIGYILPESPDKVYCLPDKTTRKIMRIGFYGAGVVGGVLVLIGIIAAIVKKSRSVY